MQLSLPQISQPLKIWEKIEVVVGSDDEKGSYLARIEDFVDGGIVISNPEFQQGKTLLRDNCDVIVLVTKEDAVYQFYSTITKVRTPGRSLYLLTPPTYIRRVQRRQFVRVELFSKARYANLGARYAVEAISWTESQCVNLSGGGMCLKCSDDLEPPNILLVEADILAKLKIPQPLAAICRRTFEDGHNRLSGVEFVRSDNLSHHFYPEELEKLPPTVSQFDSVVQNRLVTHVFQHQIELRKKGLM